MSSELWALLDNGKLLELAEDIVYEHSYEPSPRFSVFTGYSKDFMNYQDNEEVRPKSLACRSNSDIMTPNALCFFVQSTPVNAA